MLQLLENKPRSITYSFDLPSCPDIKRIFFHVYFHKSLSAVTCDSNSPGLADDGSGAMSSLWLRMASEDPI